ncbi:MAG: cyclic lactone autoinducer peptide [Lachnospiraceae bacterium]|nr:cyclic lactone autoinducer peptide [Lachnospiraceae bacterium]
MKKLFSQKLFGVLNAFALLLVASTANSACLWLCNQPDYPEAADRFKLVK